MPLAIKLKSLLVSAAPFAEKAQELEMRWNDSSSTFSPPKLSKYFLPLPDDNFIAGLDNQVHTDEAKLSED